MTSSSFTLARRRHPRVPAPFLSEQWTAATAAFNGGNLPDAITKGTAVKTKAAGVLTTPGMPVPEALQG